MLEDERVTYYFEDIDMQRVRIHQAQFISSVTGGPVGYSGGEMETAHEGMGITSTEFDAIAAHLNDALVLFDVDDEGRQAVLEEIESYRSNIVTASELSERCDSPLSTMYRKHELLKDAACPKSGSDPLVG
ncbi:globin [Natrialba taiwanensis DSM 12281]|uniref:Globin n=1 Tax=Natrialba taiwanensis DSM 12281 TaxID=1230458 RepID=M0A8M4_9EURY|nr:globin [Natrialba taiwanensis DSM 12281]